MGGPGELRGCAWIVPPLPDWLREPMARVRELCRVAEGAQPTEDMLDRLENILATLFSVTAHVPLDVHTGDGIAKFKWLEVTVTVMREPGLVVMTHGDHDQRMNGYGDAEIVMTLLAVVHRRDLRRQAE